MKSRFLCLLAGGAVAFWTCFPVVGGKKKLNDDVPSGVLTASRTPEFLLLNKPSMKRGKEKREPEARLLLRSKNPLQLSCIYPSCTTEQNMEKREKRRRRVTVYRGEVDAVSFCKKHPGVAAFCIMSGIVAVGVTPVVATAIACATFCTPQWVTCFQGVFSNRAFYCDPGNNKTISLNRVPTPLTSKPLFPQSIPPRPTKPPSTLFWNKWLLRLDWGQSRMRGMYQRG